MRNGPGQPARPATGFSGGYAQLQVFLEPLDAERPWAAGEAGDGDQRCYAQLQGLFLVTWTTAYRLRSL